MGQKSVKITNKGLREITTGRAPFDTTFEIDSDVSNALTASSIKNIPVSSLSGISQNEVLMYDAISNSFVYGPVSGTFTALDNKVRILAANSTSAIAYDTIAEAIAVANSGDSIYLGIGPYAEGNLILPAGVRLQSLAGTRITGDGANTTLIVGDDCILDGYLGITAPNVAGKYGVDFSGTNIFGSGGSSIVIAGAGVNATGMNVRQFTTLAGAALVAGTMNTGFLIQSGSLFRPVTLGVSALNANAAMVCSGSLRVSTLAFRLTSGATQDGIILVDGCDMTVFQGSITGFSNAALRITSNDPQIQMRNVSLTGNTYDVVVDPGLTGENTKLHMEFCDIDRESWSIPNGWFNNADFHVIANSDEDDAGKINVWGEITQGMPEIGYESSFGGGDAYDRGILVYTSSSSGFTDVTSENKAHGETFALPGLNNTNAIYVCSSLYGETDYIKLPGIRTVQTVSALTGSGRIQAQYWNGVAWTKVNTMPVCNYGEYVSYPDRFLFAGSEFLTGSTAIYMDFRLPSSRVTWAKNDPMGIGTNYYWLRFIPSGTIDQAPTFSSFKGHTHRTNINEDGFQQMYGYARTVRRLPWDSAGVQASTQSPGNQNIFLSDTMSVGRIENAFSPTQINRIGTVLPLPLEVDTSSGISFQIMWYAETGAIAGQKVVWKVRWDYSKPGTSIYSTEAAAPTSTATQQEASVTTTITAADVHTISTINLDISMIAPRRPIGGEDADWIWFVIERDATNIDDTVTTDAILCNIRASYFAWNNGGHVVI